MNKTIIALDFDNRNQVLDFLKNFDEKIHVKIGMELFYSEGISLLKEIQEMGHDIFLDLKLHDIPNTVKKSMKVLSGLGINMVNLHAGGGIEMMKYALEGLEEGKKGEKRPLLIAVTQLTSTSQEMMNNELLIQGNLLDATLQYALNAKKAGLDGVVCSVHEAKKIHEVCGNDFLTITPGIRLKNDSVDDQKRVATPEYAKEQGSDFIVVGRSITNSADPKSVYYDIEKTME